MDPVSAAGQGGGRLTLSELAREADTTAARIERLVEIGAIKPSDDGSFSRGDVLRATLVEAFEQAGIGLDHIELGIAERLMAFDFADLLYRVPGPRSTRSFAEFVAAQGERGRLVPPILAAMGLVQPDPDRPITIEEEELLAAFLAAWDIAGDDIRSRAARIVGDASARIAEGWVGLFEEAVPGLSADREMTVDELIPQTVVPASRLAALVYPLVTWLIGKHLELTQNQLNIEAIEQALVRRGLVPARLPDPPAIVFADLAGYTRLTEDLGDESGARTALRLAQLAVDVAHGRDGRLVKLLGDGVMLHFGRPVDAASAALDLVDVVTAAGLPPAHVGIDAGRVIARDGDYFGHTVNLAARISARAGAGEVLASADLVAALGSADQRSPSADGPVPIVFGSIGRVELKGIAEPVELFRAHRGPAGRPHPGPP
jgi:class 3 adenylate cyclase